MRNITSPGGVVGHIARQRTADIDSTLGTEDRWMHFDQVGSVMAWTDAAGDFGGRHDQDAWGNVLAGLDVSTGTWTGTWAPFADQGGWHYNSKETDPTAGLVYMYQRWYNSETGTFMSVAPYPPMVEHAYGFGENNPPTHVDPDGRQATASAAQCAAANNAIVSGLGGAAAVTGPEMVCIANCAARCPTEAPAVGVGGWFNNCFNACRSAQGATHTTIRITTFFHRLYPSIRQENFA